jgi:hypothetical protein
MGRLVHKERRGAELVGLMLPVAIDGGLSAVACAGSSGSIVAATVPNFQ